MGQGSKTAEVCSLDELLERVGHHDARAFDEFHQRMRHTLLAIVRRQLVDVDQSQEVLQEVWLEIWLTANRFRSGRGHASSWVSMIARRRAIDRVRASEASRRRDLRVGIRDHVTEPDTVPEDTAIHLEFERALAARGCLTRAQWQAIDLVYVRGLSCVEAAALAHVAPGTLKTRLRDGLGRLRTTLEPVAA